MLLEADACQLVLVDYQTRLLPAIADGAAVLANAVRLARMAQALQVPICVTEQNPTRLGPSADALAAVTSQARARVLAKMAFSAWADGLDALLRPPAPRKAQGSGARSLPRHLQNNATPSAPARNAVVIAGIEAHVCLLQTALDLLENDFDVWVVSDACGSRTERNRDAAYDRLAANGAELVSTEMVAFEWLRSAAHPLFREIQGLIK